MCLPALAAIGPALSSVASAAGSAATAITSSSFFAPMMALATAGMKIMETSSTMRSQNKMAEAQADAANKAALADYAAINTGLLQQDQKTALEQTERIRQGMRERAMILVSAGESGVSGNSPMRQLNQSLLNQGYDTGILETNQDNYYQDASNQRFNIYTNAKGRVNDAKSMVEKHPWMKTASAGVSGFASGYSMGKSFR